MISLNSIYRIVDGAIIVVSKRLKVTLGREARSWQRGVCEAVRAAAESTCGPFAVTPGTVNKDLGLIIDWATGRGDSARSKTPSSHTTNRNTHAIAYRSLARSGDVLSGPFMPNLPGAHGPCDFMRCGV